MHIKTRQFKILRNVNISPQDYFRW